MQNHNSIAVAGKPFPRPTDLSNPAVLASVADDLRGLAQIWNDDAQAARAMRESDDLLERLKVAERIVSRGLPSSLAEYPLVIRAQHDAPFDVDQALTSIEFIANTFNGGSGADMDIYIRSLVETAADARLSPAVLWRARKVLNRTRESAFRLIPKDLLDAGEQASGELMYLATVIEQAFDRHAKAVSIMDRRTEIEAEAHRRAAEEAARNEAAAARLAKLKAEKAEREAAQQRKREQQEQLLADIDARVESGDLEKWMGDLWRRHSEVRDDPEWQERIEAELHAVQRIASSTPRGARMMDEARAATTRKLLDRRVSRG